MTINRTQISNNKGKIALTVIIALLICWLAFGRGKQTVEDTVHRLAGKKTGTEEIGTKTNVVTPNPTSTATSPSGVVRHRVVLPPLEPITVGTRYIPEGNGGGYHAETKTVRPVSFIMGVLGGDPVDATREQIKAIRDHKARFAEDKARRERVNKALLAPNPDQAAIEAWLTAEAHADGLEGVVVALKDGPTHPIEKWAPSQPPQQKIAPQPQPQQQRTQQKQPQGRTHEVTQSRNGPPPQGGRPQPICGKQQGNGHQHGTQCLAPQDRPVCGNTSAGHRHDSRCAPQRQQGGQRTSGSSHSSTSGNSFVYGTTSGGHFTPLSTYNNGRYTVVRH